jgi:hypothetical protein
MNNKAPEAPVKEIIDLTNEKEKMEKKAPEAPVKEIIDWTNINKKSFSDVDSDSSDSDSSDSSNEDMSCGDNGEDLDLNLEFGLKDQKFSNDHLKIFKNGDVNDDVNTLIEDGIFIDILIMDPPWLISKYLENGAKNLEGVPKLFFNLI